jgi:hypothetical protein
MATQNGPLNFTGAIADITFYKRKDSDKLFAKQKAGPTNKQIRYDPRFRRTGSMCDEWKGCTLATQWVRRTLHPLDDARDYNFVGFVSRRLKAVQQLDTEGIYGQRSVWLSRHPPVLEGFSITRKTPLDTLLSAPLTCTMEKESSSARVEIPRIVTGINFQPVTLHPYFRIVASLGVVPDIHYTSLGYAPKMPSGRHLPHVVATDWTGVKKGMPETILKLQLPYTVEFASYSLVLAVAISFGTLDMLGDIQAVKYTGSGRIVKVV